MFLEISQNSQENTCPRVSSVSFLVRPATLLKKRLWHRCFPVNFVKFLRTPFLQNTSGRLLLKLIFSRLPSKHYNHTMRWTLKNLLKFLTKLSWKFNNLLEAVVRRCSVEKVLLQIHLCLSPFFNKVAGLRPV